MRDRIGSSLVLLLVVAFLVTPVRADLIWVPMQVAELQDAIDIANPFDVIIIDGGTHAPIVVDKPLTLVGMAGNRPFLRAPSFLESGDACIQLAGPGSGVVTLSGLETGGLCDGQAFSLAHSGISGSGFDQLRITHCVINTPEWIWPTGIGDGGSAIDVDIPLILVQDSTVVGGTGTDDGAGLEGFNIPKAGCGIETTGDVVLQDTSVLGGAGYSQVIYDPQYCPPPCSQFSGGLGGIGLRAKNLWMGASVVEGGAGGIAICQSTSAWCHFPDGEALDVQAHIDLVSTLETGGPITLGKDWSLGYELEPTLPAFLAFSLYPTPPTLISEGYFFMDPLFYRLRVLPVPGSGMGSVLFAVPKDPVLLGLSVIFQTWQPGTGLSSPVMATATWD